MNETWVDCDRVGCSTNSFLGDETLIGPGDE